MTIILLTAVFMLPPNIASAFPSRFLEASPTTDTQGNEEAPEIAVDETVPTTPIPTPLVAADDMSFEVAEAQEENNIVIETDVAGATTTAVASSSEEDYIIGKINEYRAEFGLSPVAMNAETCSFASLRAEEVSHDFSHDGFHKRIDSGTLPYAGYSKVTENLSENYGYRDVVDAWRNSATHAENMRADTPFVCVKGYGSYYAYEGWRP